MTTDQKQMLQECLADDNDRLSDWEIEFLESLNRRPEGYELSEKQAACLSKINEKVLR